MPQLLSQLHTTSRKQSEANIRMYDIYGRLCAESERLLNFLLRKIKKKSIRPKYSSYLSETTDQPINMMMNIESCLEFFKNILHIAKKDGFEVLYLPQIFKEDVESWETYVSLLQKDKNSIDPKLHVCLDVLSEVIGQLVSGIPPTGMPESLSEKVLPQKQKDEIAETYVSTNQRALIEMVNNVHKLDEDVTKHVKEAALNDKYQKASTVPILNVVPPQSLHSEQIHDSNICTDQLAPTDLLSASLEDIQRSIASLMKLTEEKIMFSSDFQVLLDREGLKYSGLTGGSYYPTTFLDVFKKLEAGIINEIELQKSGKFQVKQTYPY